MNDSNESKIKVTDKRLFTADGELREEYRDLEPKAPPEVPSAEATPANRVTASPPPDRPADSARAEEAGDTGSRPREAPYRGRPTVFDLIGVVAQPIALYLGDAKMPDGESMENLDLARLYIDLLEVLKDKTEGNLAPQEAAFLEDLLYQLRLRFVEKRKQGGGD